ncbi:hypothetical protein GCM10023201_40810 [Actinomycetospora corticicola]|uniref:Uncharacterized protein n=1 Tax=Actinomycetospora corticicola TaxID=663602 RepID=A0A7Y9J638_9PSEU|nr:hypothetical protein [Actinomycetospora corticicola]NYD36835.1 hypothetical protein [Actinomycetospora corticicola]
MTGYDDVVILVAIIGGTVNVGASAAVVWNYWRSLRTLARDRGFRPKYGLLVWHVVSIASAWSGMWALLVLGLLETRGVLTVPRPVRLSGYVFAAGLGLVALALIACESRRRVQRPPTSTTVVESTATVVHGDEPPATA